MLAEKPGRMTRVKDWIDARIPMSEFVDKHVTAYPTPKNISYLWNFGSLAGAFFVIQILTGIFLTMHYKPDAATAFASVEHIMRDVNWGWLIRYLHATGATAFFFVIYVHIFRGLYYGSYKKPRELLWFIGLVILIVLMATAFTGYLLPWGQMSYWGAAVITNLFSAIPLAGPAIVEWLRGGFSISDPTLNRFFSMHVSLLPLVILALVTLHLSALHRVGSGNPTGFDIDKKKDALPFHPYFTIKDAWFAAFAMVIYFYFVFYLPNRFIEADNFIEANPLQTPSHIVPEWYLLPFYAILRAIPDKLLGVVALGVSLLILFALPYLDRSKVRSATYRPIYKWMWAIFLIDTIVLGWVGGNPPEGSFVPIGKAATTVYFLFFISLPIVSKFERPRLPKGMALNDEGYPVLASTLPKPEVPAGAEPEKAHEPPVPAHKMPVSGQWVFIPHGEPGEEDPTAMPEKKESE